jgi:hypothetical protein
VFKSLFAPVNPILVIIISVNLLALDKRCNLAVLGLLGTAFKSLKIRNPYIYMGCFLGFLGVISA